MCKCCCCCFSFFFHFVHQAQSIVCCMRRPYLSFGHRSEFVSSVCTYIYIWNQSYNRQARMHVVCVRVLFTDGIDEKKNRIIYAIPTLFLFKIICAIWSLSLSLCLSLVMPACLPAGCQPQSWARRGVCVCMFERYTDRDNQIRVLKSLCMLKTLSHCYYCHVKYQWRKNPPKSAPSVPLTCTHRHIIHTRAVRITHSDTDMLAFW